MTVQLGVVMDPPTTFKAYKDSTVAMLYAAQQRGWQCWCMALNDLSLQAGKAIATMYPITVLATSGENWFELGEAVSRPLSELSTVLMRKDPPFDLEYIVATYLLEQAEREGLLVVNKPQSLRDANEKLFTAWFPQCCVETLVTRQAAQIREFLDQHH